ncbi:hypothetical protein ACQR05_04440 [Bradyrhizobium oligotrophicum]|uniref:hypothetical protein n=1 Tax=Bradyrhizobium oligotrophicum TaxID=44255 RepID=UPI003EBF8DD6
MKCFRTHELFLGVFLSVAVFAMGFVVASSQQPSHSRDQSTDARAAEQSQQAKSQDSELSGSTWLTKDAAGFFTFVLVIVGGIQAAFFFVQLRLIRDSLKPAESAAKAAQDAAASAKTQADALMATEGARLYVVVKNSNVLRIFQLARMYDNSPTMHASKSDAPEIEYILKNYGKTPATLIHVWHGISVGNDRGGRKTLVAREGALEIIGVDGESRSSVVRYDESYTFGDSRALATDERVLTFFGQAEYQDVFGALVGLEWEFIADGGKLHQIKHREQRRTPDDARSQPI